MRSRMAKGKHSPALFEVVHGKKHFDRSATVLRTPNWWFKGRHRGPAATTVDPGEPPSFTDENDPTLRGLPSPTAEPPPESQREIQRDQAPEPELVTADYESSLDDPTAFAMPHPRRRGSVFQFVLDRDRHELFVRVRYTTAIVAGFAVLVLIGMAYLTGRHFGRGPAGALATQSSEEVAAGPIEKGVMDVAGRGSGGGTGTYQTTTPGVGVGGVSAQPAPASPRVTEASVAPPVGTGAPSAGRAPAPSAPARPADLENGRRIVGRQYVVIQAYAGDQKKLAEEARDFLIKNGVSCTVEQGVAGWPSTWHSVVSTHGFDRASGPQYEQFIATCVQIGKAFAGKSAWKQFEPTPVRWKETN
jgi:hypothetical protein